MVNSVEARVSAYSSSLPLKIYENPPFFFFVPPPSLAFAFLFFAALFTVGLYTLIAKQHFVKKVIGLAVLQTGAFLLFINLAVTRGGTAPILEQDGGPYMNPLPHVLILTAIVVGVATLALGLALAMRIYEAFGTIEEDEILDNLEKE